MESTNDTTNVNVVPIEVTNDTSNVSLAGIFFNQSEIREEDEPAQALSIAKDTLDHSSGYIVGRFKYSVDARAKIIWQVAIDGRQIDGYGTGTPYGAKEGIYDTTLFRYPGSARTNKDGPHKVHVEYGLITGIVENALGLLDWGKVKSIGSADFTITLLPHTVPLSQG
jgi:hypothetical protein